MTTLTGSTPMKEVPKGPPFVAAMGGAVLQLGTLGYVWGQTSARACLLSPLTCFANPLGADPWGFVVVFVIAFALFMWIVSLRMFFERGTSDSSIVDRLWSIMPCVYVWFMFLCSDFSLRMILMTALSTIWGARLTFNFWIKGGFSGGEDYRWSVVRTWYPGWKWEVFNLVFICLFQQVLLLAFVAPTAAAMQSKAPLGPVDIAATALYALLLLGEAVADRQMYTFQTEKYRRKAAGEPLGPYSRGFIETGLWAYSRHPNYFCEVMMWFAFYLFSVNATGQWLNWTLWGAAFLSGLFVPPGASCDVTEAISLTKYPEYAEYQQRVNRFVPMPPKKAPSANGAESEVKFLASQLRCEAESSSESSDSS